MRKVSNEKFKINCAVCNKERLLNYTEHIRNIRCCSRKCSGIIRRGRPKTPEEKLKNSLAHIGKKRKPFTMEHILKMRKSARKGKDSPLWKGGKTSELDKIRQSDKYRDWRRAVFERDNYTCVLCKRNKEISGKLNADHIKPFALFSELRFDIDNGRTLCIDCHKTTDTYFQNFRYYLKSISSKR